MMEWCEFCRDHYEVSHFGDPDGYHLVGAEYGPTGAELLRGRRDRLPFHPEDAALTLRLDRWTSILSNTHDEGDPDMKLTLYDDERGDLALVLLTAANEICRLAGQIKGRSPSGE